MKIKLKEKILNYAEIKPILTTNLNKTYCICVC